MVQPDPMPHHMQTETTPRAQQAARPRVLIVEDDVDLREMMVQLLKLEGINSEAVANGREALEYLNRRLGNVPHLILLDLMMPVMDGWEFLRQKGSDAELAGVPVIVLSAIDRSRAGELRADGYLVKPLDFERLLGLIRTYCA